MQSSRRIVSLNWLWILTGKQYLSSPPVLISIARACYDITWKKESCELKSRLKWSKYLMSSMYSTRWRPSWRKHYTEVAQDMWNIELTKYRTFELTLNNTVASCSMLTSRTITITWRKSRRNISCSKFNIIAHPPALIKIGLLRKKFLEHTIKAIVRQHVAPLEFEETQSSNSACSSCCSAMAIARKWDSWGSILPTQLCLLVTNKQQSLQNTYF